MVAAEERDLHQIRRGLAIPKGTHSPVVKRIREVHLDLPTMLTPPFLLRSNGEGSNRKPKVAWERIKRALLLKDMKVFEQTDDKGLIGRSYAFSDFISNPLTLSFSFFLLIFHFIHFFTNPSPFV